MWSDESRDYRERNKAAGWGWKGRWSWRDRVKEEPSASPDHLDGQGTVIPSLVWSRCQEKTSPQTFLCPLFTPGPIF